MFAIGSHLVCPGMGVAQVTSIDSRELSGANKAFYILKILSTQMKMMVAVDNNNLRPIMNEDQIKEVFTTLRDHSAPIEISTWNKRHAKYHDLIRTGSAQNTAIVYRDLMLTKKFKTLSFGERKMLEMAQNLLTTEIVHSTKDTQENVTQNLEACFEEINEKQN
jgi:CarD family transcriptional regulator